MSRPVKLRVNYRTDAAFLLRLEAAIEQDNRQSPEWIKETVRLTRQLAQRLLQADAARTETKTEAKPKNVGGK